jgi:hypothetical protein
MTGLKTEEELIDMANVGLSLMNAIDTFTTGDDSLINGWSPADDPAEIVGDLYNMFEESLACHRQAMDEVKALQKVTRDEKSRALSYGWRHALHAAATTAHGLIAMDHVADHVRAKILSLSSSSLWRPIAEADKGVAYIVEAGSIRIGNSYPIWARDNDGRVFECLWADDGKRSYWWDIEGESPVDPVEFMPHPFAALASTATEGGADV